jgi:hypothetical protein
MDAPSYYTPYETDNESESDSDYDSEDLPDYEDARIRREQDPRYAILRIAGPNFNTEEKQIKYQENAPGSNYLINTKADELKNSLLYFNPTKTVQTSLFSLKSSNRDKSVYKTSSYFSLKLPRVYKNVTKFQLVQLSYPNFSNAITDINNLASTIVNAIIPFVPSTCVSSCFNVLHGGSAFTSIGVYEATRNNSLEQPMYVAVSVPEGVYNGKELATELNKQMNNTPAFSIMPYETFKNNYQVTQDLYQLFNEPGEYFGNSITGSIISNPTKDTILTTYFPNKSILTSLTPTDNETFVAYYYPVLKELIASGRGVNAINTLSYGYQNVLENTLYTFNGLSNVMYYEVCSTNRIILDQYRRFHSFENRLVNKYNWSYNDKTKRFSVVHNTLNTSLTRDINSYYDTIYNNELKLGGLTQQVFKGLQNSYVEQNSIFKHLESIISSNLSQSHGVTGYSFGNPLPDTLSNIYLETTTNNSTLNGISNFTETVGDIYNGFSGMIISTNNFSTLHNMTVSYSTLRSNSFNTVSTIHGRVSSKHHMYVSTKYSGVLPNNYITSKSYLTYTGLPIGFVTNKPYYVSGSPINYSSDDCEAICRELIEKEIQSYYSCLPVNSIINSLAYKLGIFNPTSISSLNIYSTLANYEGLGNFNVLMQINTDQSFNNMDIAMNENYNITNETTGQTKYIAAKILTGGIGANDISQTVIQNPILFDGTLGKLDKLTIRLLLDDTVLTPLDLFFPFDLPFTEWDATFQIDEEVALADRNAGFNTVPTVQIPDNSRPI